MGFFTEIQNNGLELGKFQIKIMENRNLKLPSFQDRVRDRALKDSQADDNSICIKFSVISNQSLPYLGKQASSSIDILKHFKKKEERNKISSEHIKKLARQWEKVKQLNKENVEKEGKTQIKLARLRNQLSFQKMKRKNDYDNLRINSIIQCASKQLLQQQNEMLKEMI